MRAKTKLTYSCVLWENMQNFAPNNSMVVKFEIYVNNKSSCLYDAAKSRGLKAALEKPIHSFIFDLRRQWAW